MYRMRFASMRALQAYPRLVCLYGMCVAITCVAVRKPLEGSRAFFVGFLCFVVSRHGARDQSRRFPFCSEAVDGCAAAAAVGKFTHMGKKPRKNIPGSIISYHSECLSVCLSVDIRTDWSSC